MGSGHRGRGRGRGSLCPGTALRVTSGSGFQNSFHCGRGDRSDTSPPSCRAPGRVPTLPAASPTPSTCLLQDSGSSGPWAGRLAGALWVLGGPDTAPAAQLLAGDPRGEVGSHPAPHEEHSLGDVSPHCRAEGLQGTRRPWSLWQCNPLPQPPAPAPRRGHGARAGPARWCSRLLVSLLPPAAAEPWVWGLPGAPVTASHREPIPPGGRLPSLHSPCPRGFAQARGRWQWAPCARA